MSQTWQEEQDLKRRFPSKGLIANVDRVVEIRAHVEKLRKELRAMNLHIAEDREGLTFTVPSVDSPTHVNTVTVHKDVNVIERGHTNRTRRESRSRMNIERRKSNIHGNGVFARRRIDQDDWCYFRGEFRPLQFDGVFDHFCLDHGDGESFLPYAPFCWLNHSKVPNCEVVWCEDDEAYHLVALAPIDFNEELTIDYGYQP